MDTTIHRFHDLFAQLGLPNDSASIQAFLMRHAPIASEVHLPEAPCWTPAQSAFLEEALQQDSDWSELVDQLNAALQQTP